MSRTKILTCISKVLAGTLFAGTASIALAHQADLHHWFEHERARTDGGYLPIFESESTTSASRKADRLRVTAPEVMGNETAAAPDCLVEEMKRAEGYVPFGPCAGGHAQPRWVVDEDKKRGRHAEQARVR